MDGLNKEPALFCHDHKRVVTHTEAKNCAAQGHILSEHKDGK